MQSSPPPPPSNPTAQKRYQRKQKEVSSTEPLPPVEYEQKEVFSTEPLPVQKDAFRVQLMSDVHLEINVDSSFDRNPSEEKKEQIKKYFSDNTHLPRFSVKAPYLALLGDIGYPHSWVMKLFLTEQASRYQKVFVVAGNHEFYSTPSFKPSKEEVLTELKKICSEHENLVFLDKGIHIIDNFRIIGTTLWEPYGHFDSNDTNKIYITPKQKLTFKDTQNWFHEEFKFIQTELDIAKKNNQHAIVMTHHPPPSDLVKLTRQYDGNLPLWMFGHTHNSSFNNFGKTLVISNQVGYLQLGHKDTSFFPECVVEVVGGVGKVLLLKNEYEERIAEEKAKEALEWEKREVVVPPPPPPPRK